MILKPYMYIAVAAVVAALIAWGVFTHMQLNTARAQAANLTTQLATAVADNASDTLSIKTMEKALLVWRDTAKAQESQAALAIQSLADEQGKRKMAQSKLVALERAEAAVPLCASLLTKDLAQICPTHAEGIKARAK